MLALLCGLLEVLVVTDGLGEMTCPRLFLTWEACGVLAPGVVSSGALGSQPGALCLPGAPGQGLTGPQVPARGRALGPVLFLHKGAPHADGWVPHLG